jgi:hypothetical protein
MPVDPMLYISLKQSSRSISMFSSYQFIRIYDFIVNLEGVTLYHVLDRCKSAKQTQCIDKLISLVHIHTNIVSFEVLNVTQRSQPRKSTG